MHERLQQHKILLTMNSATRSLHYDLGVEWSASSSTFSANPSHSFTASLSTLQSTLTDAA